MTVASAINNLGGAAGTSSYFLDPGAISSRLDVGPTRQALDGTRPMLIRTIGIYIGGRGGARSCTMFVGNASTGSFVAGSGNAGLQGPYDLQGTGYLIRDTTPGAAVSIGYNVDGPANFGWNSMGGNSINHSNPAASGFANRTLAGVFYYQEAPPEPRYVGAVQIGVTTARVNWYAPEGGEGGNDLVGYRVQAALDDAFTIGVVNLDVGLVYQADLSNLIAGSRYRFRVLARNAATIAAGTYSPASEVVSVTMIAETGNIDSWATFGGTPAGVVAVTASGLRRATVAGILETPSALLKESNVTAAPVSLAGATYGAKRTVAGLTPGKVYRLSARAAYIGSAIDSETPVAYALGIHDMDEWADPIILATPNLAGDMPALDFTATATEHAIAFRLENGVTETSNADLERFAIWDVTLAEIPSFSPYRLQSIVYESSLANHFDLANNSVGARWWVDSFGVTQFAATLGTEGAIATFTDAREEGHLEYTDIRTSLDTRNIVNDLTIHQHGAVLEESGWNANDQDLNFKELTSIATNSIRQADMDMSLYSEDAYEGSIEARVAEIFADYSDPTFIVNGITWNAQENPEIAARLDVYSPIDVIFRGLTYELRIVNIKHRISPTRWMMDLELDRR